MVTKMFELPATSNGSSARDAGAGPRRPVVMVAGATGGVGKRVVRDRICPLLKSYVVVCGLMHQMSQRLLPEEVLGTRR